AHSSPHDTVFALESRADFYFLADRRPATPYLWGHPLNELPGALAKLAGTLAHAHRPKFVILFQRPGPRLAPIVRPDYALGARAPQTGTAVLAADPDQSSPRGSPRLLRLHGHGGHYRRIGTLGRRRARVQSISSNRGA